MDFPVMSKPLVSIAMPVRNCELTVVAAVRSILNQTCTDWELLVFDDGSTDGTLAELRQFQDARIVIFHDGQSKGLPVRLNEAMAVASGEYFARMDGDDVSYPKRLELQVDYLRSHSEIDLVGGGVLVFGKEGRALGKRIPPERHQDICRRPYAGFPMVHPTFLGRIGWFRFWMFNLNAGGACDQDLLIRSFEKSRLANALDILLGYREEKVFLRKCVRYRLSFSQSLISHYHYRSKLKLALCLAFIAMKSVVDTVAVLTGLQHRLLRHRARPVTREEVAQWSQIWKSTNSAHGAEAGHVHT